MICTRYQILCPW